MTKPKKNNKTLIQSQPQPQSSSQTLNFTHALTRVAVGQICQSVGYTATKSSALETLTTVAGLYLKTLTNLAATNANRFGRTESNLLDVVVALVYLGSVKGFKGGSDVNRGLLKNSVLSDLIDFVDRVDEIPFAQSIRGLKDGSFGVGSESGSGSGSGEEGNVGGGVGVRNVPNWLPRFPDVKSYVEDDAEGKGRRFGCGEVLFPHGGVEGVSVSGDVNVEKVVGKRECRVGELRGDRCRVKFGFGAKRRKSELDAGVCGEASFVGLSSDEKEKERNWKEKESEKEKEKEKNVYVRRGLLLKNGEKRIVQRRKEVL